MITLEMIAAQHEKWLRVAKAQGLSTSDAEDAVQNTYLYFAEKPSLEKYEWKGRINEAYVMMTVQSRAIDMQRGKTSRKNHLTFESETKSEDHVPMTCDIPTDQTIQQALSNSSECIRQAFERMGKDARWRMGYLLFQILTDDRDHFQQHKFNIAKLSRVTGVSKYILYNERKKVQEYLCQECGEEVQTSLSA